MTTIIVEEVAKYKQNGVLHLEVLIDGTRRLERDISASKVDTLQKLALWLVTQVESHPDTKVHQVRRQATIEYHVDDGPVIDNI